MSNFDTDRGLRRRTWSLRSAAAITSLVLLAVVVASIVERLLSVERESKKWPLGIYPDMVTWHGPTDLQLGTRALYVQKPSDRSLTENLFAPEQVLQSRQKVALRPDQLRAITRATEQFQKDVAPLQWRMQDEEQRLAAILNSSSVNETDALAQFDRVLAVERDAKRAHIAMLVRIKNTLTPEQQRILKAPR